MKTDSLLEINNDWTIMHFKEGLQMLPPECLSERDSKRTEQLISIGDLIKANIHVYFLDNQSVIQSMNETALATTGFASLRDAKGYTGLKVSTAASFAEIREYDIRVLQREKMITFEGELYFLTGEICSTVDYKFPWYNKHGFVQGIIGIGFIMGSRGLHSLAKSIETIAKTGLLSANATTGKSTKTALESLVSDRTVCGVYLSKREHQCIQFLLKGFTAKMIAKMTGLSYRTVEHYIDNTKIKLNVSSRAELICKVMEQVAR